MQNSIRQRLESRQHAGRLLAGKLISRDFKNALVLAIPRGGIPVGIEIARTLELPFEIVFSKRIRHPAHGDQSIGAVSLEEVTLHESTQFIPQSYVLNQITLLQRSLQDEFRRYYGDKARKSVKGKIVILTDDVLRDLDELTSCLVTLEKEQPKRIVVAAAVISLRVMQYLEEYNFQFHYLYSEMAQQSKPYTYFSELDEAETLQLLRSG